jgi:hypothetical protein
MRLALSFPGEDASGERIKILLTSLSLALSLGKRG